MIQRRTLLSAAGLSALSGLGQAQDKYPSRLITWICPYAAGGGADARSRQVAKLMQAILGQTIIVDNKAGGGGNVGTDLISKARPDGYTIGMGNFAPLAVNHALFKKLNFDPFNDLVPIMLIERGPLVLMVRNESPFKSVKDVVAAAKAKPGTLTYASGGIGGTHHLSGALFEHTAGIDMIHVPYKGTGPAVQDTLGGHIDVVFTGVGEVVPHVTSGDLRALAVMSETRIPALANVPTTAEAGYPGFIAGSWMGMLGPANLPRDVATWLSDKIVAAAQLDEFRLKAAGFGMAPALLKGPETGAFMRALSERSREAITKANITAD